MGLFDSIKESYGDITGLISRLQAVESAITSIENWRHNQAIPDIASNLERIATAVQNITTIDTNVTLIWNKIQAMPDVIKAELDEMGEELTTKVIGTVTTYVDEKLMPPLRKLTDVFTSLGEGVKSDVIAVRDQGVKLTDSIGDEARYITDEFVEFGKTIKSEAIGIGNAAGAVATQMTDAVKEIKPSIEAAAYEAKQVLVRANALNPIGAAVAAYWAMAYMLFAKPKTATAQGGPVLPEMMEAYNQISSAFKNLKNQFVDFGGMLKYRTDRISNQFTASQNNIKGELNVFMGTFKKLFDNMAVRIKGGAGEVMTALSAEKVVAAKVLEYKTSEQLAIAGEGVSPIMQPGQVLISPPQGQIQLTAAQIAAIEELRQKAMADAAAKAAADKLAAEKAAADKLAAEKAAADKLAAQRAAAKIYAEKLAAQKAAAQKIADEQIAADKADAAEKAAAAEAERIRQEYLADLARKQATIRHGVQM